MTDQTPSKPLVTILIEIYPLKNEKNQVLDYILCNIVMVVVTIVVSCIYEK